MDTSQAARYQITRVELDLAMNKVRVGAVADPEISCRVIDPICSSLRNQKYLMEPPKTGHNIYQPKQLKITNSNRSYLSHIAYG